MSFHEAVRVAWVNKWLVLGSILVSGTVTIVLTTLFFFREQPPAIQIIAERPVNKYVHRGMPLQIAVTRIVHRRCPGELSREFWRWLDVDHHDAGPEVYQIPQSGSVHTPTATQPAAAVNEAMRTEPSDIGKTVSYVIDYPTEPWMVPGPWYYRADVTRYCGGWYSFFGSQPSSSGDVLFILLP